MSRTKGSFVLLDDGETFSRAGGCLLVDDRGRAFDIAALFEVANGRTRSQCMVQRRFEYRGDVNELVCVKEAK